MNHDQPDIGDFTAQEKAAARQKCFLGYSHRAWWSADTLAVCRRVLPDFQLELWADIDHYETDTLRKKVLGMIANTHFGIYDLSFWRKNDNDSWMMPRNVLIELGIAIAFNRPMLLLRHASNSEAHLPLPSCLESMKKNIVEFSSTRELERLIHERLTYKTQQAPEQDWQNSYCTFGERVCGYREVHPYQHRWEHGTLYCHISTVSGLNRPDVSDTIEQSLTRFENVEFTHLDALSPRPDYQFLLCSHCQTVRKSPFALYYITPKTPAEAYIAIGINLALEAQFKQSIPKIFLTHTRQDIPSLLEGYEVIEVQNAQILKLELIQKLPPVLHYVKQTHYRARPLPFIVSIPKRTERPKQTEQQRICSTCGHANRPEAKFCTRCGNPLTVTTLEEYTTSPDISIEQPTNPEPPTATNKDKDPLELLMGMLRKEEEPRINAAEPNTNIEIPNYTIVGPLAEGGMNTVYLVEHKEDHKKAVLKVMLSKIAVDRLAREEFLREVAIIRLLQHKNVVSFIDNGVAGSIFYFLMEYCDGGSTSDLMSRRGGHLSVEEAVPIMLQTIEGLAYMHEKRIVHRDLKPQNILLASDKNKGWLAKIADMSLAKNLDVLDDNEVEGRMAGTFVFMPREQVTDFKRFKPVSDVWSMGATCYNMLTGMFPRDRKPRQDPLDMVLQNEIIPIRKRNPSIPTPLAEVIDRSLQPDIKKRYQDGGEMLKAFTQAIGKTR